MLPTPLQFQTCFPFVSTRLAFHVDTRKAGESLLLVGSLIYASGNLSGNTRDYTKPETWISIGPLCFYL